MKNLYKIRNDKNISQLSLSIRLGVSQETISGYETGKSYPSVDNLIKLCDIFNVSSDYLLDRTDVHYTIKDFCDKNISVEELELLSYFRKLSPLQKNRAIGLVMGMAD